MYIFIHYKSQFTSKKNKNIKKIDLFFRIDLQDITNNQNEHLYN